MMLVLGGISVLLAGCSIIPEVEKVSIVASDVVHMDKNIQLTTKTSFEHELRLIDSRIQESIKILKPFDYEDEVEYENDMKTLVKELASSIDRPMIPAKLSGDGKLLGGQSRVILDEEVLLNQLLSVGVFDKEIELPITETEPNVSMETVLGLNEVVLGSFRTTFSPAVKNRNKNISLSAKEINQIVLGPGDRFYWNTIVGDTTPDKGYQLATVIVNKEFVQGYGGGICQTSSTLFNAVEKAGLEIIELHHHSKEVGYVPKGRDATIAYGFKDFKFINNKDYPIAINTIVDEQRGFIEVQITSAGRFVASR